MLDNCKKALLAFDELPPNESNKVLYNEIFRTYHNIKSGAGMMEYNELQLHVQKLKTVLMQTKESSSIPKPIISWFLRGNDATRAIMNKEPYEFNYDIETQASKL